MHLANMYKSVKRFKPKTVVLDPITNLISVGLLNEVNSMLLRMIDFLQKEGITLMLTALNSGSTEHIDENVSSLVDAWLLVRDVEANGERNRALYIMKSRGMQHSKEVREFVISSGGLKLVDVYRGSEGILIGSARETKEKQDRLNKKNNKPTKK
jgi:circadian clock protein KaiC